VGYCPTDQYIRGSCDLADVMAISGAAISPTAADNILVRALLVLFNFRLGQWMNHPTRPPGDLAWPSPLRLVWGYLMVEPQLRDYLFVSDGGHTENTGISTLLQRRSRVIIACDSSQDGNYEFADLRKLLLEGENKYGVRFWMTGKDKKQVRLDDLTPEEKTKIAKSHFLVLRIEYPADSLTRAATLSPQPGGKPGEPARSGYLIYIKPNLTGDESEQLSKFKFSHPSFPHDPTLDQFFEPNRFLAYRELGEHIGEDLCAKLFPGTSVDQVSDIPWLASNWVPQVDIPIAATSDDDFGLHSLTDLPFHVETAEKVFSMLRHSDAGVRQVACTYLCEYGPECGCELKAKTIEVLLNALKQEQVTAVQIELCKALSWVGEDDGRVLERLTALAANESVDPAVRTVCEILAKQVREFRSSDVDGSTAGAGA
jgi:HEAT repeats